LPRSWGFRKQTPKPNFTAQFIAFDNWQKIADFLEPTLKEQVIVLIAPTQRKAEKLIESCEHCNPEGAEIPFDNILDRVTGSDPSVTDYILETPGKCPRCFHQINEKTLVEPNDCEN